MSAKAIITLTDSGRSPELVARHRPRATIIATSPREEVVRQLALVWGIVPILMPGSLQAGEDRLEAAVRAAHGGQVLHAGDLVVLLGRNPVEGGNRYPTIRVARVGEGGQSLAP